MWRKGDSSDAATALTEGMVDDLAGDHEGDDLIKDERDILRQTLSASKKPAVAGRLQPSAILDELPRRQ